MKKKGFTLIELLAVIIILAVIALIATPVVLNVVDNARKEANKNSAYGILDAAKLYYAESLLDTSKQGNINGTTNLIDEIKISGKKPDSGYVYLNDLGQSAIAIIYDKVCYKKDFEENDMIESNDIDSCKLKISGRIKLSSNSGNYIYPTSGTFEIIENISGGELSCTSSDESIATCSISETTVTVTPGIKKGNTTITILSSGNDEYKEAKAAYVAITDLGSLSVTANEYIGTYDGSAHGITVTSSEATVKYGTIEGTYDLEESPTYTDAGTYTVYYKIEKEGYKTVTGSKQVVINKAEGTATLSSTSGTVYTDDTMTFTVSEATGEISCISSDESIATCNISGTTVTVNGISKGTTTITINVAESTNYNATSKIYSITVEAIEPLSTIVKLGDYITYKPTITSYTPSSTLTGNTEYNKTSPTLNPSELTSWRVLKINDDGTIDIVSTNVSTNQVYFYGKTGYINFVKVLNDTAEAYINSAYAIKARSIGYDGQTEAITDTTALDQIAETFTATTSNNSNEAQGGGDTLYLTDINQMNSAGISLSSNTTYWLASRFYNHVKTNDYMYTVRAMPTSGSITWFSLYNYNSSGIGRRRYGKSIRPVVTLKSGIRATGTGTSADPYVLK